MHNSLWISQKLQQKETNTRERNCTLQKWPCVSYSKKKVSPQRSVIWLEEDRIHNSYFHENTFFSIWNERAYHSDISTEIFFKRFPIWSEKTKCYCNGLPCDLGFDLHIAIITSMQKSDPLIILKIALGTFDFYYQPHHIHPAQNYRFTLRFFH